MLIHEAATRTGLPARRIRYYESLGLVRAARQGEGAYRSFSDGDLERLRFIAGSRRAGLSLDEVAAVLGVSEVTVRRRFRIAKAWLYRRLSGREPVDGN